MYKLIATCPNDLKEVVATELKSLGAKNVRTSYMAVYFEANEEDYYKIHLKCSTASQILQILRESSARNLDIIFSQAKRINWPQYIPSSKSYKIDVKLNSQNNEISYNAVDISKKTRLAIEHVFHIKNQSLAKVNLKEPDIIISVYIDQGRMTVSLVSSGKSLHKRGYRTKGHPAPIKETLAATLLKLSNYDGKETLLDPMAGSGTIAIEACMLALNKAAHIHRKKGQFGFEHLNSFNKQMWRQTQEKTRLERIDKPIKRIIASDINSEYIEMAKANALRARVEKYIEFSPVSFFEIERPEESGLIIANLPYGARLQANKDDTEFYEEHEFYQAIGTHLKTQFYGWRAALLCPEDAPWKSMGLKPSKKFSLLNGSIKTKFLIFEIKAK